MSCSGHNPDLKKSPCCERGHKEDDAHKVEDEKTCQDVPENDNGNVNVDFGDYAI